MLEIKNALAVPPENFFFFYAASATLPVKGEEWPSRTQVMIAVGGAETGDRATDLTYSAMPRFLAFSPRNDWRFFMDKFPKFGLAGLVAGDFSTGWRIDGMVDKTAMWRAWRSHDGPALSQQLGLSLEKAESLPEFPDFSEFAEKIVVPLMPRRRKIIQMAWNALSAMPQEHWPGEYLDGRRWRQFPGERGVCYHNWASYPSWAKDGTVSFKKSRKLISPQGKFLCGPTIRSLNREVMRVVEQLEAGTFG